MRQRKTSQRLHRLTVGYVRVSTTEQADKGTSLEAQEARIRAYAAAMELPVDEVIADPGVSAKTLDRPGITRVLKGVREGSIGRVIVLKLDRLTRSTRDLADVLDLVSKHDAALVSVSEHLDTTTASGRMVVNMFGVVGQWEREVIAERTAENLGQRRRTGKVYGSTPFGYQRIGSELKPVESEQVVLAEAIRMDREGASFREIGRMLTERGAKPKRSDIWHAASVRAMLRSRIVLETAQA